MESHEAKNGDRDVKAEQAGNPEPGAGDDNSDSDDDPDFDIDEYEPLDFSNSMIWNDYEIFKS